jgi:ATP-dependent DNA helicase RecG
LQNLRVLRDEKTIVEARGAAIALLDDDPGLDHAPELRLRVTELQESRQSEFMEKS